jgi:hypothetical protein
VSRLPRSSDIPRSASALGLVDRDEALSAAPEYASVVNPEGGGATVGSSTSTKPHRDRARDLTTKGRQRQVAGEAGVYQGIDLEAGTSRAEYQEGYDSLSSAFRRRVRASLSYATGCGSLG